MALNNEELIKALVHRRELINKFRGMLPNVQDFDIDELQKNIDKCSPVPEWKQVLFRADTPESIYQAIIKQDMKIEKLAEKKYDVSSIIVTFQTQRDQQNVLDHLVLPALRKKQLQEEYKFDGIVLNVQKLAEPTAIRWDDFSTSAWVRIED